MAVAMLLSSACAGSASTQAAGATGTLAPGSYTLSFALDSAPGLRTPVSGASLTVTLPPGVTVATAGPGVDQIASGSLSGGSALTGPTVIAGRFAAVSREAALAVATVPPGGWSGELLRLRVEVQPGAAVSEADLQGVPVRAWKSVGIDDGSRDTVALTDRTRATIRLTSP